MTNPMEPNRPIGAKPLAQAPQNQLIDRAAVARALDADGNGKVSKGELGAAGVGRIDPEAWASMGGGTEVGVEALGQALASDKVRLAGEGVGLANGQARFQDGRLERAAPWSFPVVEGVRILNRVKDIAPSGWSYYNPDSPGSQFTFEAFSKDRMGNRIRHEEGMRLQENEFVDVDGYVKYRGVEYDELASVLREKARLIQDITSYSKDGEIQDINREVSRVVSDSVWGFGSRRDRARDLFRALSRFDNISVPAEPEAKLTSMDASLKTAASRIEEQGRISREIGVDRARDAVGKEASRLRGFTPAKAIAGVVAGAGAAAAAFFGASLAVLPVVGIGLGALALGFGIAHLISASKAKGLESDLEVLRRIDPAANRKALEQNTVVGYKVLQDARTADTLAALRAYTEAAGKTSATVDALTSKVASETQSLQNMEAIVRKYGA